MSKDIKSRILSNTANFSFFQILVEVNELETFGGMLTKDEVSKLDSKKTIWIKNNDSVITPENWNEKKDVFCKQRFETYNTSYTDAEKIKLEIKALEKLTINEPNYEILNNRYKEYLLNELKQPQPKQTGNSNEVKENKYINVFKNDIGYSIFLDAHFIYKEKNNQLANYSALFYALQKEYLVCNGASFIRFLSELDIHIEKIDSRQSGKTNKTALFNSIQNKYQK